MRRSLHLTIILLAVLVGGALAAVAPSPLVADAQAAEIVGLDTFLGYDIGEERRYVVGPDDALRDGESITWSVRLDSVETAGDRRVGVFHMTHEQKRYGMSARGPMYVHWIFDGEARINEFGFPEQVGFTMHEQHTGESQWRGEDMFASYTFNGTDYDKVVRVPDQEWEFTVPIATHGDLDLSVPSGAFLFRPVAIDTDFFTNPALLGFAIPDLLPEQWEQRTLFFAPEYPIRHPTPDWIMEQRDTRAAVGRYWVKNTLKLGGPMQLEIGDRVLNVRKLDITGPVRAAYLDEFGRVVRIDIDPDVHTRKQRHIRLLFPSEY